MMVQAVQAILMLCVFQIIVDTVMLCGMLEERGSHAQVRFAYKYDACNFTAAVFLLII